MRTQQCDRNNVYQKMSSFNNPQGKRLKTLPIPFSTNSKTNFVICATFNLSSADAFIWTRLKFCRLVNSLFFRVSVPSDSSPKDLPFLPSENRCSKTSSVGIQYNWAAFSSPFPLLFYTIF